MEVGSSMEVCHKLEWNPINTVTNGPKKVWLYLQVTILTLGFFTRKCMAVFPGDRKKGGRNNKVAVRQGFTVA